MPLSQSPLLTLASNAFATIFIGFGINAMFRPAHALSMFAFAYPTDAAQRQMIDHLMIVYGARDVFMGLAMYAAAAFGSRRALGAIVLAGSAVAGVDGVVCKMAGEGEWQHWGYAPILTVVGALLMG